MRGGEGEPRGLPREGEPRSVPRGGELEMGNRGRESPGVRWGCGAGFGEHGGGVDSCWIDGFELTLNRATTMSGFWSV